MTRILLCTTRFCGFCLAAKRLLATKGLDFEEIDVGFDPEERAEIMARSGGRYTVPQIFIHGRHVGGYDEHGRHVGGYDELAALERAGELDSWLEREPETLALETWESCS